MFDIIKKKYSLFAVLIIILMGIGIWISGKSTPNFEQYAAGTVRKTVFFNYFLPLIEEKNRAIMSIRKKLLFWRENSDDLGWWQTHQLDKLVIIYRVKNFSVNNKKSWQKLLEKVDVLPPSLVLAQAANESAWGTSRFATQGNNYFGQWCFEQGCGLVPQQRDSGKAHEVATFSSPKKSLGSYMQNLNSHPAYQTLRNIRTQLRINKQPVTGDALAAGLTSYSERGIEYIEELRAMIKFNKLGKHDQSINNSKTLL